MGGALIYILLAIFCFFLLSMTRKSELFILLVVGQTSNSSENQKATKYLFEANQRGLEDYS